MSPSLMYGCSCADWTLYRVVHLMLFHLCFRHSRFVYYDNQLTGVSKVSVLIKTIYYNAFLTIGIKHLVEETLFLIHIKAPGNRVQPWRSRFPNVPTGGLLGIDLLVNSSPSFAENYSVAAITYWRISPERHISSGNSRISMLERLKVAIYLEWWGNQGNLPWSGICRASTWCLFSLEGSTAHHPLSLSLYVDSFSTWLLLPFLASSLISPTPTLWPCVTWLLRWQMTSMLLQKMSTPPPAQPWLL